MNEREWLVCDDLYAVLDHIAATVSDRKLRLMAQTSLLAAVLDVMATATASFQAGNLDRLGLHFFQTMKE